MVQGCRKNENVSSSRNRRKRSGMESFVRTVSWRLSKEQNFRCRMWNRIYFAASCKNEELGFSNKITFMLKDTELVDFSDNAFDAVVSRYAFWLFNNPKKVYAQWYRILKSGRFQDYYHDTDMMDELKKLPLSYVKRPEWDLEICRETGFKNIETETLSQEKYWNSFMARRYRTMPTFIIKAQK